MAKTRTGIATELGPPSPPKNPPKTVVFSSAPSGLSASRRLPVQADASSSHKKISPSSGFLVTLSPATPYIEVGRPGAFNQVCFHTLETDPRGDHHGAPDTFRSIPCFPSRELN